MTVPSGVAVGDLLVSESVPILQNHRRAPLDWQLIEHGAQAICRLARIQLAVQGWQFAQPLLHARVVDVEATRLPPVSNRVLLHQIAGYRVEVELRVTDRFGVAHP